MARAKKLTAEVSGEESNRARFVRLAEKRLTNALQKIGLLGSLGNKAQYEYTEEDVKVIAQALQQECVTVITRLQGKSKTTTSSRFK